MKIDPTMPGTGPLDPLHLQDVKPVTPQPKEKKASPQMEGVLDRLRDIIDGDQGDDEALNFVANLAAQLEMSGQEELLPGFIESRARAASLNFRGDLPAFLTELNDPALREKFDHLFHKAIQLLGKINGLDGDVPDRVGVGDADLNLRGGLSWLSQAGLMEGTVQFALKQFLNSGHGSPHASAQADSAAGGSGIIPLEALLPQIQSRNHELEMRYLLAMKRAAELEAEFGDMIPVPEQVSILELIHEWMKILQALDKELTEIAKKQEAEKPHSEVNRAPKAGSDEPELKLLVF